MNGTMQGSGRPLQRLTAILLRAVRGFVSLIKELDYAQRRSYELFLNRDGYLVGPVSSARTYREFLSRTARPLVHEPTATARLAGDSVR